MASIIIESRRRGCWVQLERSCSATTIVHFTSTPTDATRGGAIFMDARTTYGEFVVRHSHFVSNLAMYGSAIRLGFDNQVDMDVDIYKTTFENPLSSTASDGGHLYFDGKMNVTLDHVKLTNGISASECILDAQPRRINLTRSRSFFRMPSQTSVVASGSQEPAVTLPETAALCSSRTLPLLGIRAIGGERLRSCMRFQRGSST